MRATHGLLEGLRALRNVTEGGKDSGSVFSLGLGLALEPLIFKGAERVGFEPTVPCGTSVFKTDAIDHSATSPEMRASLLDRRFVSLHAGVCKLEVRLVCVVAWRRFMAPVERSCRCVF